MQPFRRKVFYLPGYDPFPPRRYREFYRREGALQAQVTGATLAVTAKVTGPYGWTVQGADATADFDVLIWSDIVKNSMPDGILATYLQMIRTVWVYVASGAVFYQLRLRKGPMLAALYPVVYLVMQALIAGAFGLTTGWGLGLIHPVLSPLGLAVAVAVLHLAKGLDHKIKASYLIHDYAYTAQHWGAYPPALEQRMAEFGARIRAALGQGYDEVLLVGHSSGAYMGVTILADLLRQGPVDRLAFLTLGQVVPMLSFLPRAGRLRRDLRDMSRQDQIAWVDVTAPGDGCCFALCDPVAVSGVAAPDQKWPLVLTCAFTQTLSPARWRDLRWQFVRLHFQYICAFDRPGIYDYFAITAGAQTLAARFQGVAPSKSRVTRALSPYRTLA